MIRGALFEITRWALVASALTCVSALAAPTDHGRTDCVRVEQCCKVCDKGKACGNSCISRRYTCHKGSGCACDADRICEE